MRSNESMISDYEYIISDIIHTMYVMDNSIQMFSFRYPLKTQ